VIKNYILIDITQRGQYCIYSSSKDVFAWMESIGKKMDADTQNFYLCEKDYLMFKLK